MPFKSRIMTENYFNSLKRYLKDCSSEEEYQVILNMDHVYSSIFLLSKQGELEEAKRELILADQEYYQFVKSTRVEDHVNIVRQPIIAYLVFKLGDFDQAEVLLEESIESSLQLEKKKESFLLKMYRVQQYHNYARILFKKEEYNEWSLEMTRILDHSLNYSQILSLEETLVYEGMVDQLIYEVIKFSDIIKEEKYLERVLKDWTFKHPLFITNETLSSLKNWCIVKSKVYEFQLNFIDAHEHIENVLYDDGLKDLYKKSLLKSIAPYINDTVFINYLNIIKREKLIC